MSVVVIILFSLLAIHASSHNIRTSLFKHVCFTAKSTFGDKKVSRVECGQCCMDLESCMGFIVHKNGTCQFVDGELYSCTSRQDQAKSYIKVGPTLCDGLGSVSVVS
jgi:hypothetical protein